MNGQLISCSVKGLPNPPLISPRVMDRDSGDVFRECKQESCLNNIQYKGRAFVRTNEEWNSIDKKILDRTD
jgi:hypothetical protein